MDSKPVEKGRAPFSSERCGSERKCTFSSSAPSFSPLCSRDLNWTDCLCVWHCSSVSCAGRLAVMSMLLDTVTTAISCETSTASVRHISRVVTRLTQCFRVKYQLIYQHIPPGLSSTPKLGSPLAPERLSLEPELSSASELPLASNMLLGNPTASSFHQRK